MEEKLGKYIIMDSSFDDFREANIYVAPVYYDANNIGHMVELGPIDSVGILSFKDTEFFYDDTGRYCLEDKGLSISEFIEEAKNAQKYQVEISVQFYRR